MLAWISVGTSGLLGQDFTGHLLLRNRNLVQGTIVPSGLHFRVRQTNGSELVIPKESVDATFQTATGAYDYLASRAPDDDVEALQQLFHWCMRYQLWPQAQQTLDRLQTTNISASRWLQYQGQLEIAQRPLPPKPQQLAIEFRDLPAVDTLANPSERASVDDELMANPGVIRQVSFEAARVDRQHLLSENDLDALLSTVPAETWKEFHMKIEPALLRDCTNSGCHDSRQREFTLIDAGLGRNNPERISQQNLYRVLQHVQDDNDRDNGLLQFAATAHAGLTKPVWSPGSREHELLTQWLGKISPETQAHVARQVAEAPRVQPTKLADSRELPAATPPRDENTKTDPKSDHKAVKKPDPSRSAKSRPEKAEMKTTDKIDPAGLPRVPSLEADARTFVPRDEFDPEIFNRFFSRVPETPLRIDK